MINIPPDSRVAALKPKLQSFWAHLPGLKDFERRGILITGTSVGEFKSRLSMFYLHREHERLIGRYQMKVYDLRHSYRLCAR